jgi:hypothetical protein
VRLAYYCVLLLPKAAVAEAKRRGQACLETLLERILPRLMHQMRLLGIDQHFSILLENGTRGPTSLLGRIDPLAEDRFTKAIVVHEWWTRRPGHFDPEPSAPFTQPGVVIT